MLTGQAKQLHNYKNISIKLLIKKRKESLEKTSTKFVVSQLMTSKNLQKSTDRSKSKEERELSTISFTGLSTQRIVKHSIMKARKPKKPVPLELQLVNINKTVINA